ncbi:MAG: hypothetical protein V1813_00985 [Candidatus Aenigmatarchaeota archaeon]
MEAIDRWFESRRSLERDFTAYVSKGQLREDRRTTDLAKLHMKKAESNLDFSYGVMQKMPEHAGWAITGYYYAAYHASLALLAAKGITSKSHLATICALIRHYHGSGLDRSHIDGMHELGESSIRIIENLKEKRETASYGLSSDFEKSVLDFVREKSVSFVNAAKDILEVSGSRN